jgi:hypothetical protein
MRTELDHGQAHAQGQDQRHSSPSRDVQGTPPSCLPSLARGDRSGRADLELQLSRGLNRRCCYRWRRPRGNGWSGCGFDHGRQGLLPVRNGGNCWAPAPPGPLVRVSCLPEPEVHTVIALRHRQMTLGGGVVRSMEVAQGHAPGRIRSSQRSLSPRLRTGSPRPGSGSRAASPAASCRWR